MQQGEYYVDLSPNPPLPSPPAAVVEGSGYISQDLHPPQHQSRPRLAGDMRGLALVSPCVMFYFVEGISTPCGCGRGRGQMHQSNVNPSGVETSISFGWRFQRQGRLYQFIS